MAFWIGNPEYSHYIQYLSLGGSHNIRYPLYIADTSLGHIFLYPSGISHVMQEGVCISRLFSEKLPHRHVLASSKNDKKAGRQTNRKSVCHVIKSPHKVKSEVSLCLFTCSPHLHRCGIVPRTTEGGSSYIIWAPLNPAPDKGMV